MAELRTDPMRGPLSALDRHVWKGEMDDLRAAIERVPGPGLDRVRENTSAGVLTGVTTILVFAIILPTVVRVMEKGWSAAAPFAAIIPVVVLYVLLPFPMPHYPLADAPTDLSNYPR